MTTQFVLVKSPKSSGIAILLVLLFGPVGLFYASVIGGLTMTFFIPIALIALIVLGAIQGTALLELSILLTFLVLAFYWLICIIWAVNAVKEYNDQIEEEYKKQQAIITDSLQNNPSHSLFPDSSFEQKKEAFYQSSQNSNTPSLKDWMKENPGRSINDYYMKFGNPSR